jgi:hypothetical protein
MKQTRFFKNGAKRIRTADPLNAIEVRYQLRYNPLKSIIHNRLNISILSSFWWKINFEYLL